MAWGGREDLYNVHVIISGTDGKKVGYTFDKMSGGDVTAKNTKYRPGNGTSDEISLGGPKTVNDITVTGYMDYNMYLDVQWMMTQVGKAHVNVNKQPLDSDGAPYGKALTYSGKLDGVKPPDTDSSSENAGVLALTVSAVTPVNWGTS